MFFDFCTTFLKSIFNFKLFEKKAESHSLCFSEIKDGKRRGYANV